MALHPQCKAFLDGLAAMGGPPLHELPPAEARALALPPDLAGPERPVHQVVDRTVPGPAGRIPVRVYRPTADSRLPGLVYLHGGGFVLGTLDSSDRPCRALALDAGRVVVSVDYRLAPEHPFPAAVDDAIAATRYVAEHADEFGIDRADLAIGGESAGANLAVVTAIRLRDVGISPSLTFQLLIYPLVDHEDASPSMREFSAGHFITAEVLEYFATHYLGRQSRRHPDASPVRADLHGLPPALVITAECDPLRDQGEAFARTLQGSGVPVTLTRYEGMIHPFFSLAGIIDGGKQAIADAAAALRDASAHRGARV